MRILITNDDGIRAEGLIPLVRWAKKLGEVTVIAPKFEQSGKSHGIEILKCFEAKQVELDPGVEAWAVDSTPADCVRFAVLGLNREFDLVISGINRGLNIGCDIMYSGTVAAVFEASALGIKSIAVSTEPKYYSQAVQHMDAIYDFLIRHELHTKNDIYNVNIPENPGTIRITRQGGPFFSDEFEPRENDMFMPIGKNVYRPSGDENLDTDAVLTYRNISVTPLTINRTSPDVYRELVKLNS